MTENADHKLLKKKVCRKYESKNYTVSKEVRLENGLIVDVVVKNAEEKVAIEVGALNTPDRLNVLKEEFDRVIHLPQLGKPKVRNSGKSFSKNITLYPKHIQAIEELKERPGGFNFSQYVQKKLEEDFPEKFG